MSNCENIIIIVIRLTAQMVHAALTLSASADAETPSLVSMCYRKRLLACVRHDSTRVDEGQNAELFLVISKKEGTNRSGDGGGVPAL